MLKPIVSYVCIMCSFVSMFASESMDRNLNTPQASSNLERNTSLLIDRLILSPEKIYWYNNRDLQNLVRIHSDYIEAIMSNSTSDLTHLQDELQMAYNTAKILKQELTNLQNLSYSNLLIKARGLPSTLERLRNQVHSRTNDINEAITNIQLALTMLTSAASSIDITRINNTDAAINNNPTTREAKKNLINTMLNVNSLITELNTGLAARTRNTNTTTLRTSTNQTNPLRTSTQQTTNTTSTLHNTNQTNPLGTSTQQPDPLQKEAISYIKSLNKVLVNNRDVYDTYHRVYENHKNTYTNYINAKTANSLTDSLKTQLRNAINDLYTQLNTIATAKSQAPTTVDVPRSNFTSVLVGANSMLNDMLSNIPCAPIIHQYNATLVPYNIDAYKWNWNENFYTYFPNSGPKEIKKLLQLNHLSGEATDFYVTVQNLNDIFLQGEGLLLLRPQWIFAQSENYNKKAHVTGNTRTFVKISESDNPTISEVNNPFNDQTVWFHPDNTGAFAISNENLQLNNISEGKSFVCVYYFNATGLINNPVAGVSIVYNETDATAWENIKISAPGDIKDKLAIAPVIKDSPTLKRLLCLKPY